MVRNNIEVDVKVKCIESEITQVQLAENIGTTSSYVNRIVKKKEGVVNKTFVQMMEALGYDIELITEIAERMGVKAEITDMSFDALIAAVQNGKVDVAIASIGASEERKQAVDFTKTYHKEMNNVYVVRKDSGIQFTDKDEITGYKVGMQSGSLPDNYITSLIEEGKMDEKNVSRYESDEAVILDLAAGRIEVAAGDITTVEKFLEQYDIEVALRMAFYDLGENIAVQKNEDELTKELDNIIDEMYEDGYLEKLGEKWGIE